MQVAERSLPFMLVVAIALTAVPVKTGAQMRPVDLVYQKDPAKRAADVKELDGLLGGIEKQYKNAEATLAAGQQKEAAEAFVEVAKNAGRLLVLYENLGFNFRNKKLGYPHYLLYKLESQLTGVKESKGPDGATVRGPADPQGAKILVYAGVLGRPGQPSPKLDETVDVEKLHNAAGKVMEFVRDKIISANVPLQ